MAAHSFDMTLLVFFLWDIEKRMSVEPVHTWKKNHVSPENSVWMWGMYLSQWGTFSVSVIM
jgi:hypothetical protein